MERLPYPIPIQRVRADSIHGFHFDIHIPYQFNARHPAITGTTPRRKVSQGCMVEAAEALRYIYIYIDVTWRMRKLLSASDPFERAPNPVTSVSRRGLFTQPTLRICWREQSDTPDQIGWLTGSNRWMVLIPRTIISRECLRSLRSYRYDRGIRPKSNIFSNMVML